MNWFGETLVQLDFEFNRPMERNMGLVAMSWNHGSDLDTAEAMKLTEPSEWARAREIIGDTMQGKVLVAHNAVAEASCFVALGLNPRDFTWACTMLEYRQLQNSNNEWSYGKYYKDMGAFGYKLCESRSMFKRSDLSEWDTLFGSDREQAIAKASSRISSAGYTQEKVSVGLVNARLNLLGMQGDPGFKSATRDKIIAGRDWTEEDWAEILDYAKSDVVALDKLLLRLTEEIQKRCKFDDDRMKQAILWRGRSACNHAIMERQGTPINVERWRNLVHNKPLIIRQEQEKFQKEVWPIFEWDRKENRYKTRPSRELATPWVEQMERELGITWPKSDNGNWSWATDPGYPMDQYNKIHAGITALNKLNGIINGLKAHTTDAEAEARKAGGKKVFADYLGSDGYVRPYLNAYGSQTSRTQPSAISYIYLQASWMRALIDPPPGWVIAELDFGSQESLISGVVSGDANMIGAYESGDPYLAFAIDAGLAPEGATKKTHKAERDVGKLTILACNYGMGAATLNLLFLSATGKAPGLDYCKGLLALHKKVYKTFYEHKDKLWYNYREAGRPFVLPDGWYLDIDNPSRLSALNFITGQGHGGAIARVAEEKILHAFETRPGVALIGRVHDAFVYMRREDDTATDTLVAQLMKDACTEVLGVDLMRIGEPDICRHGELWTTEKNEKMLERMSKYFLESMTNAPQNFLSDLLDERI